MTRSHLHGVDRRIMRAIDSSDPDALGQFFTRKLREAEIDARHNKFQVAREIGWNLRRVIRVAPDRYAGVQIILESEGLEGAIRSYKDDTYYERWVAAMHEHGHDPFVITLPLPYHSGGQCMPGDYILVTDTNFENLDDSSNPHTPFMILWQNIFTTGGKDDYGICVNFSHIKEIRFVTDATYTPKVDAGGNVVEWSSRLAWYLEFRRIRAFSTDEFGRSREFSRSFGVSEAHEAICRERLLVPGRFSFGMWGGLSSSLWKVGDYDADECRTPPLEHGYFLVKQEDGALELRKIVDRLCWPGFDPECQYEEMIAALYVCTDLYRGDDMRIMDPYEVFRGPVEIIQELAHHPAPGK